MTRTGHDAVVIGAGPNGLVAANLLADRGWSVLVLESQAEVGGAVRSDTDVAPGFVHDTFSAFYPLAAASPTIRGFRLEEHGLIWRHAPAVLGHPSTDGQWALLHRDRSLTARLMEDATPGDGDAWLALCDQWDRIGDQLVGALLSPFPPVRSGFGLATRLPRAGGLELVRSFLTPAAELVRSQFAGRAPQLLMAGNAGHADIPLDAPGSGLMGMLMSMLGQTVGFPVPEGGASRLSEALAGRFTALGGEVRCDTEVVGIDVDNGRATGVRTAQGERHLAARAVIADVSAPALFGRLLASNDVPARVRRGMRDFRLDPSTIKVDWALDGPIPWVEQPVAQPGAFHVADSLDQMQEALGQVAAGVIPNAPYLLAGQMTTTDPTRSPPGTESVWAYTHVPQDVRRDAGGDGLDGRWHRDACERLADRMERRLEAVAPGFTSRVIARRVLGPRELEARNANLMGGAIGGGTAQLHQQLVFRPVPGLGRAETGVASLYLGSASAHPGGGVHGAPGSNAARAALLHDRLRRPLRRH